MQHGCEVIYPAVLHNTIQGKAVYEKRESRDLPYFEEAFGLPLSGQVQNGEYGKRIRT